MIAVVSTFRLLFFAIPHITLHIRTKKDALFFRSDGRSNKTLDRGEYMLFVFVICKISATEEGCRSSFFTGAANSFPCFSKKTQESTSTPKQISNSCMSAHLLYYANSITGVS